MICFIIESIQMDILISDLFKLVPKIDSNLC